jgi:hypothetical protein
MTKHPMTKEFRSSNDEFTEFRHSHFDILSSFVNLSFVIVPTRTACSDCVNVLISADFNDFLASGEMVRRYTTTNNRSAR